MDVACQFTVAVGTGVDVERLPCVASGEDAVSAAAETTGARLAKYPSAMIAKIVKNVTAAVLFLIRHLLSHLLYTPGKTTLAPALHTANPQKSRPSTSREIPARMSYK
jgi:hypothetical protein